MRAMVVSLLIFLIGSTVEASVIRTPSQVITRCVVDLPVTPSVPLSGLPTVVSLNQAKALIDENSVKVIDARSAATFKVAHIPNAKLATVAEPETLQWLTTLAPTTPVLVYCGSKKCKMSSQLAKYLINLGFSRIYLFEGGISDWKTAGYSIESIRK